MPPNETTSSAIVTAAGSPCASESVTFGRPRAAALSWLATVRSSAAVVGGRAPAWRNRAAFTYVTCTFGRNGRKYCRPPKRAGIIDGSTPSGIATSERSSTSPASTSTRRARLSCAKRWIVGRPAPTSTRSFSGKSSGVTATRLTAAPVSRPNRPRSARIVSRSSSASDMLSVIVVPAKGPDEGGASGSR